MTNFLAKRQKKHSCTIFHICYANLAVFLKNGYFTATVSVQKTEFSDVKILHSVGCSLGISL
jgi:hypothetical protein